MRALLWLVLALALLIPRIMAPAPAPAPSGPVHQIDPGIAPRVG